MFRSSCGRRAQENAAFCSSCGQRLPSSVSATQPYDPPDAYEVCQITWEKSRGAKLLEFHARAKFFAVAIGPNGKYSAGESNEFTLQGEDETFRWTTESRAAHNDLVAELVQYGWQPAPGTSTAGYDIRFSRSVSRAARQPEIRNVNENTFQSDVIARSQSETVLAFFWASWVSPCREIDVLLPGIAQQFVGRMTVARIDADKNKRLSDRLGVNGLPMCLFFKAGREQDRLLGADPNDPRGKVVEIIQRLI